MSFPNPSTGGGGAAGAGAAGQVTYWDTATTITGSAKFTWDNAGEILSVDGDIRPINNSDHLIGSTALLWQGAHLGSTVGVQVHGDATDTAKVSLILTDPGGTPGAGINGRLVVSPLTTVGAHGDSFNNLFINGGNGGPGSGAVAAGRGARLDLVGGDAGADGGAGGAKGGIVWIECGQGTGAFAGSEIRLGTAGGVRAPDYITLGPGVTTEIILAGAIVTIGQTSAALVTVTGRVTGNVQFRNGENHNITVETASASATGASLSIQAASGGTGNTNGGALNLDSGPKSGSGVGGGLNIGTNTQTAVITIGRSNSSISEIASGLAQAIGSDGWISTITGGTLSIKIGPAAAETAISATASGAVQIGESASYTLIDLKGLLSRDILFSSNGNPRVMKINPKSNAGGTGESMTYSGQAGNTAGGGFPGGDGGALTVSAPNGGDDSGGLGAGNGAALSLLSGGGGTVGAGAGGTSGAVTMDVGTATGAAVNGNITIGGTRAVNLNLGRSAGKIGMYGVTAVVQHSASGVTTGFTANASANAVFNESTWTGNVGTKNYTISDIVAALKNVGIMAV